MLEVGVEFFLVGEGADRAAVSTLEGVGED